jgi:hypothetical protein
VLGPEGESAASAVGHGHMRVSRADRERTVDVLKVAFVYEQTPVTHSWPWQSRPIPYPSGTCPWAARRRH